MIQSWVRHVVNRKVYFRRKRHARAYKNTQTKGFIVVFDTTSKESFDNVDEWIAGIKHFVQDPVIILCGTKVDITAEQQVDVETAKAKADELG